MWLDLVAPLAGGLHQCPARRRPPRRSRCRRSGTAAPRPTAVLVCPISPAAPSAPRSSRPPVTMPTPMPVDAFTKSRSRCRSRCPRRSESAITLASLSTKTGAPRSASRRNGASSTPSQPGHDRRVQAGARARSRRCPGCSARPRGPRVRRPPQPSSRSANAGHHLRHQVVRRPARPPGRGRAEASTSPSRSQTPSWVRLRPIAPASTTPASPVEPQADRAAARRWRAPAPRSTPSTTSPESSSAPTRAATAVRDRPVSRPTSLRVRRGRPGSGRRPRRCVAGRRDAVDMGVIEPPRCSPDHTADRTFVFRKYITLSCSTT